WKLPEVAAHDNRSRGLVKHLRIRMEFRDAVQYLPVVDHNEHPWLLVVGAGSTHGCFQNCLDGRGLQRPVVIPSYAPPGEDVAYRFRSHRPFLLYTPYGIISKRESDRNVNPLQGRGFGHIMDMGP